jgi:AcrR family transcriptional regulator
MVPPETVEIPTAGARLAVPREEVRMALLDAVGHLIQRYGYRKMSVEDIAAEAHVSRATAYLYYPGKEALVIAWMIRQDTLRLESLRTLTRTDAPARDRLATFLMARVMTRFDDAQPYTESIDELLAALRPRVLEIRQRQHEAVAVVVAELLREGVRSGDFAELPDSLATARLLILATSSLLPYSLSVRELGERTMVEESARGLIALLLRGLRHTGQENLEESDRLKPTESV